MLLRLVDAALFCAIFDQRLEVMFRRRLKVGHKIMEAQNLHMGLAWMRRAKLLMYRKEFRRFQLTKKEFLEQDHEKST
jgi:hypothetical protein